MENEKTKKSAEEQVAELTEEQKKKLWKTGLWGTLALVLIALPLAVATIVQAFGIFSNFLTVSSADMIRLTVFAVLTFVACIGTIVAIKVVCPYYSDSKFIYLLKNRKKG